MALRRALRLALRLLAAGVLLVSAARCQSCGPQQSEDEAGLDLKYRASCENRYSGACRDVYAARDLQAGELPEHCRPINAKCRRDGALGLCRLGEELDAEVPLTASRMYVEIYAYDEYSEGQVAHECIQQDGRWKRIAW